MQTKAQRIALIRKAHKKMLQKQQLVEFDGVQPFSVDSTGLHYNDARQYADAYYGDVQRATTRYDNEWD